MQARLPFFVLVSLAAHAGGFVIAPSAMQPAFRPGLPELNVALVQERPVAEPVRPAGREQRDRHRSGRPAPVEVPAGVEPERRAASAPAPSASAGETRGAEAHASAAVEADTASFERSLQSYLLGELHTALARHLRYPALARQRGWEGTVLLGLTVEPDGQLERVHVARSSGYDVLDRSALHAARRIGRLTEIGARLNGRATDVSLPVIYRLTD